MLLISPSPQYLLAPSNPRSKISISCVSSTSTTSAEINPSSPSPVAPLRNRNLSNRSPLETRISLVLALASQSFSLSQRLLTDLATETAKYVFPKRFDSRNLEEALMAVPDLETVNFKVLKRKEEYEIREVEPYFIAETIMPGKSGFDFNGASQAFNALAAYLFGKNTANESMEMTTPVFTQKAPSDGEKMEMTTPVITKRKMLTAGRCHLSCPPNMVLNFHCQRIHR